MRYGSGMNAVTLSELGPILAAVLGPMLAFVVVSMRYQHLDGVKTREAISRLETKTRDLLSASEKETRDVISESNKETRSQLGSQLAEHKRETKDSLRDLAVSLGDARDRLARIEGHFGIGAAPPPDEPYEDGADAA